MSSEHQYTLVDNDSSLQSLLQELEFYDMAAVDTEADPMFHYAVSLCLIQITIGDTHWLVDPLAGIDLSPIFKTKAMQNIILHGADYDLRLLWQRYHYSPRSVFDTMLAAKFVGEEKLGLADLVYKYFQQSLEKGNQKADWTKRPLPEDMCCYAMHDTTYLHELCALLGEQLLEKKRFSWLTETCSELIEHAKIKAPLKKDPWRMNGSSRLSAKSLNILKHLWEWREKEAEEMDRPPYKVLSPDLMFMIVKQLSSLSTFDAEALPKLPRNFSGKRIESFYAMLKNAFQEPVENWPEVYSRPAPPLIPPNAELLEFLKSWRDEKASSLSIDPSMLANRIQLIALATPGTTSWEERFDNAHFMVWQKNIWIDILQQNLN
ncbi:MAG: ribonuclease D [Fibrobacter sp.]|mgnify:FL=1|nr:ribonuclease D [Fibrobacter sp.]